MWTPFLYYLVIKYNDEVKSGIESAVTQGITSFDITSPKAIKFTLSKSATTTIIKIVKIVMTILFDT